MYKLLVVDLDGTLLDNKKQISKKNLESLKKLKNKNILFTISTGRPLKGVIQYKQQLDLKIPAIFYNGAMIADLTTEKIIFEEHLEFCDVQKIWNEGMKNKVNIYLWSKQNLYSNFLNNNTNIYKNNLLVDAKKIDNIEQFNNSNITKIIWDDKEEKINNLLEEIKNYNLNYTKFCTSSKNYIEFFNKKVSKAITLNKIIQQLDIKKEEVIAIGDSNNDIEMLEFVGFGVAMENATTEIKKIAKYITFDNENSGVSNVIEKFML